LQVRHRRFAPNLASTIVVHLSKKGPTTAKTS
jgi:hypothetical protein